MDARVQDDGGRAQSADLPHQPAAGGQALTDGGHPVEEPAVGGGPGQVPPHVLGDPVPVPDAVAGVDVPE
ncbi:hypothetical protein BIV23_43165 [Streptomyces monashensis]|uniref:Uncharacterized protein n=1 Tax=Streptomyces monashensis TaxID=1678012 RepID=A0A1S2NZX9_9ACTN|nr:hypothetical protein BIV23_43165 [Streptomyces monashensis]